MDVPSTRTLTLKTADDRKPAIADAGGRRVYGWKSSLTETASSKKDKEKDDDTDQTSDAERVAAVRLTTFGSWEEVGRW